MLYNALSGKTNYLVLKKNWNWNNSPARDHPAVFPTLPVVID